MSNTLPPMDPTPAATGWQRTIAAVRQHLTGLGRARQRLAADEDRSVSEALDAVEAAATALQTGVHALTRSVRRLEEAVGAHAGHLARHDTRLTQLEARMAAQALQRAAGAGTGGSHG